MLRKLAAALAVTLAVPAMSLACEAHRAANKQQEAGMQLAQAPAVQGEPAKANAAAQGDQAAAGKPVAKKAKPKAKQMAAPKAAAK